MQAQDTTRAKALPQEPVARYAGARRGERQNNHECGNNVGVYGYESITNPIGNFDKGRLHSPDPGGVQSMFVARPGESGPSRPYAHGIGYSPRGINSGYRDSWIGKPMKPMGVQYHYPPAVYSPEYGHEINSPKPYLECDPAGYPYYMTGGPQYHRRSLQGHPKPESRFTMDMSVPNRMDKLEPGKSAKQGLVQNPKVQPGTLSNASWYERSAASFEKSKEIFDFLSKRCESQEEYSQLDQEKLVHITKERTVRQLDFNAASQALKAGEIMEKRWSTEPNGDGFRTAAKDIRDLIENNSLDATRLMYPITDVYIDPQVAEAIAAESETAAKRAVYMKQYAETTAQTYGIPLYTSSDNFLEFAEQAYLASDGDLACPDTSVLDDPSKHQGMHLNSSKHAQFRAGVPQTSLALFVNNAAMEGDHIQHEGQKYHENAGAAKVPQSQNILIKDAHVNSVGAFDRKSNTWNPNHESFSPYYDSYAIGNLPWAVNDDIIPNGPDENLAELSSGGTHPLPEMVAEACSSKEETKSADADKTTECRTAHGTPENDAPLCYCGLTCQKKHLDGNTPYWGCQASKCHAEMPINDGRLKQTIVDPPVEKSKSGRQLKPSKRLSENLSSRTEKCSDDNSEKRNPGIASPLNKKSPSKHPLSIESSGLKDSGTMVKLDSCRCRKSSLCDRVQGHRGKCSKRRNSSHSSVERQEKNAANTGKASPKASDQFCSPDKSAFHPEEELLLSKGGGLETGTKQQPSKEGSLVSKDAEKEDKVCTESVKAGKGSNRNSDAGKVVEAKTGNHEISSLEMPASKEEEMPTKEEVVTPAKVLDIEELARQELSKIPIELRCTKRNSCLNINGHIGRCRERPRSVGGSKKKSSKRTIPDIGVAKKRQKVSAGNVETDVDAKSTILSTLTDGLAKACGKAGDQVPGSNHLEPSSSTDVPMQDPATCKMLSNTLLCSSKDYINGLHLLKHEFEKLSSEHIRKFYGCSLVFPVDEWTKQKGEYLSQCSIIKQSPSLHSQFMFKSRKNRLAANDCKSITLSDLQNYFLNREKSMYQVGTSEIHGFGLFASSSIKAETPVTELLGEYLSHTEASEREKVYKSLGIVLKDIIGRPRGSIEHPRHMMYRIDHMWDLDATKAGSCARFANHSCSPNCAIQPRTDPAGAVHLVLQTLKDVQEGEELTFNYQDLGALSGFTCSCKSPSCQNATS